MTRRILFILKWRVIPYDGRSWGWVDPGTPADPNAKLLSHGLNNSCRFVVDMLNEAGFEAKLVQVADDNDIWKEIDAYGPTDVVIEAYWMRPKKLADLEARYPGLPIIIRGHSSTSFLADDMMGFPWAMDYLAAGAIVGQNDPRHVDEMRFLARYVFGQSTSEARRSVPYLPNYYPVDRRDWTPSDDSSVVNVGCFGAIRSFKNHVGQAIAAMKFADRLERRLVFHINGDRKERGGEAVSRALDAIFDAAPNAELIRHDWIPVHEDFKWLVGTMDLVTQISFAETFCIVAADAASQGVPLVTSTEVPWGSPIFQADPSDVEDMSRKMRLAWDMRWENRFVDPNRVGLRAYAERVRDHWLDYFA